MSFNENLLKAIDFIVLADIQKGEEITVNYAQGKKLKNPLWFDVSS